jgi:hypothetical protein
MPLIPATMNDKAEEQFTTPIGRPGQPGEGCDLLCMLGECG